MKEPSRKAYNQKIPEPILINQRKQQFKLSNYQVQVQRARRLRRDVMRTK